MKIYIAQIDTTVGDIAGNKAKVLSYLKDAEKKGADLVIFPELTVVGYSPKDILENPYLIQKNIDCVGEIAQVTKNTACVLGFVSLNKTKTGKALYNSAAVCFGGKVQHVQHKTLLPNYDVFDEERYFEPAKAQAFFEFKGRKIGLSLCEDAWSQFVFQGRKLYDINPIENLVKNGADLILNLSASPFTLGKSTVREALIEEHARNLKVPIVMCNLVGGNDDLVFDGRSFVVNAKGQIVKQAKAFEEDGVIVDIDRLDDCDEIPKLSECDEVYQALVLGLKDYVYKCNFKNAVVGLSGGIDSALVAAIAKEALGKDKVVTIAMPSPYSSKESIEDAKKLARNLEIDFRIIPIEDIYKTYLATLKSSKEITVVEENIQARIRGNILMAISNKEGALVLSTGNKSELAVGYCTIYGDMAGGLALISDVPKTMVYELANYINCKKEIIPENIIKKAPSAELRPNQKDQDTLPPYDILDQILKLYVEDRMSAKAIKSMRFDPDVVDRVIHLVDKNEYKRRQAAPGLKVTSKAFGVGRRFPIAWKNPL